jgi:serine/threonine protein kinase
MYILREVLKGMVHLHNQYIQHGDLKGKQMKFHFKFPMLIINNAFPMEHVTFTGQLAFNILRKVHGPFSHIIFTKVHIAEFCSGPSGPPSLLYIIVDTNILIKMCQCPYVLLCGCAKKYSVKIADFDYTRQLKYYLKPVDICSLVGYELFDYRGGTLMYRGPEVSACFAST